VTQTRIVLELWREAERVLEELGPVASSSDRAAMEADIEEIRVLYQRIQEQHAQDGQAEAAGSADRRRNRACPAATPRDPPAPATRSP
jgi:RNA binding exosome subunit